MQWGAADHFLGVREMVGAVLNLVPNHANWGESGRIGGAMAKSPIPLTVAIHHLMEWLMDRNYGSLWTPELKVAGSTPAGHTCEETPGKPGVFCCPRGSVSA